MAGPLDALNILDCSSGLAGWRMTGMLADLGADVLWIEPPGGHRCRTVRPEAASVFNRGKRSIELDLASEVNRKSLLELAADADVLVESWAPGRAFRFGLDAPTLHSRFPHLIVCSISGFGTTGPLRDEPGYEPIVDALVGAMGQQAGHREGPIFCGVPLGVPGAAYLAAIATLAAVYRRDLDGTGRHVETSLYDGALAYLNMTWGDSDVGIPPVAADTVRLVTRSFCCADDEYIGIHTGARGAFGRLMTVVGLQDKVPSREDGLDMTVPLSPEERDVLNSELPVIFTTRPRTEWLDALLAADVCAIEHLRPTEVFDSPQVRHLGATVTVDDPVLGLVEQVGPVARFGRTTKDAVEPSPIPGQHNGTSFRAPRQPLLERSEDPLVKLLDGVRVLDAGAYFAGPYSSRLLADLGADVIKLEPPTGDQLRGVQQTFRSAQANKRGLAVNLKHPEAAPIVDDLIEWADVISHNMRPGVAERLGFGAERVQERNPRVVYTYSPGWGTTGPHAGRQSFAPMLSGYVGAGFECAGQYNPPLFPVVSEDPGNGLAGAVAMLAGLVERNRSRMGQYVECTQLVAAMAHMAHIVRTVDGTVLGAERLDPLQRGISPTESLYVTEDGWICIAAVTPEQREALAKLTNVNLANDEYAVGMALSGAFAMRTAYELHQSLRASDIPSAIPRPHNNVAFMRDPENRTTGRGMRTPPP